jgi:AI-2 transport protein TqsA
MEMPGFFLQRSSGSAVSLRSEADEETMAEQRAHQAAERRAGDKPEARNILLAVIAVILIGWALKATSLITMPLAFAFFVALVVWPVDSLIQQRAPGRLGWLGHLAAMVLVLLAIALFVLGIGFVAQRLVAELPPVLSDLQEKLQQLSMPGSGGSVSSVVRDAVGSPGDGGEPGGGLSGLLLNALRAIVRSMGATLSLVTLIFFFALIMLTEVPTWRGKLRGAWGERERELSNIVAAAGERFRWYLLVRTGLGVVTAVLYGLWLWAFGLELIFVWIVLTFLLSYIPTLGSLIAGLLPFLVALATKDLVTAFLIGAGLLVIEQIIGNFVDPKLQGRELSLSPLVVLMSILVWGYIWGIGGALIAVPMTVLLVICLAHVPSLRAMALMLSGETNYDELEKSVQPD